MRKKLNLQILLKFSISWYRRLKSKNRCPIQIQGVEKHAKMAFLKKINFSKILTKNSINDAVDKEPKFLFLIYKIVGTY